LSTVSRTGLPERPRVLLVDDNDAILARARAVLAPACVVVGTAKDGPSALRAAGTLRPDVIVLDISMPEMSGFEVATKLRHAGSTAALVFLTVHADEDFVEAARAVGVLSYVVKPRLVSDLVHAVAEAHAGREFVSPLR
jgi:DNA-binding NarL/FixJ family response regulator